MNKTCKTLNFKVKFAPEVVMQGIIQGISQTEILVKSV